MAGIRLFDVHRTWEDWLGMILGVLAALSPWLAGQQDSATVMWNAVIVGALVIMLAGLELVDLHRWEETLEAACGIWLAASPFIFGYAAAGTLRYWHFALGAIVTILALVELRQDWNLSDKELAEHGQ